MSDHYSAPVRLTVMASGNGSNLQALIDNIASSRIPNARIQRVFVNRKTAFAAERAAKAGIPSTYFNLVAEKFQRAGEKDPAALRTAREKYDAELARRVLGLVEGQEGYGEAPELVVLAGWMHVFTPEFLKPLEEKGVRIINLHPALPGKYDGAGAIARAHADFQAGKLEGGKTGIMVHYVIAEVDRGAPILTREIECREGEALEGLETRIHALEHELIVEATAKVVVEIGQARGR